jgi:tripartite-type tricarboxylate transporter receptor subunit TctC
MSVSNGSWTFYEAINIEGERFGLHTQNVNTSSFCEGGFIIYRDTKNKEVETMVGKRFSYGLVICVLILSLSATAFAAGKYPSKPIQFLIPFGAGGSADVMGRVLVQAAEKYIGQPFVPINRPGAGGGIMYTALKNSKPDGYTVGWNSSSVLTCTNIGNVPFLYDAFDHVCRIGFTAMPIAVRSESPWKTFKELVDYAKKNPEKVKIGNAGTGSATHLTAVLIQQELDLKVIHVPMGAKRRIPSLLGGEMDAICTPLPEVEPQVAAGKARLLVMPTEKRDPTAPDVPTLKELGYPIVMELFRGISVPKGTPEGIIRTLSDAFKKASEDPSFVKVAKQKGFNISFMDTKEFEQYLKVQDELIATAYRACGLVTK